MNRDGVIRDAGYCAGFFASHLTDVRPNTHCENRASKRLWADGFVAGWADAHPSKSMPTIQQSAVGTKLVRGNKSK